jgi:uncharacterized protein (DUF58 family)
MPSRIFLLGLVGLAILSLVLSSPLLFLLTALLGLVAGASALWDRYSLSAVTYARRLSTDRLFCGETADFSVEIVNAKPLPLAWLKAQDEFPDAVKVEKANLIPAGESHRRLLVNLFNLRWYERVRRHYRLTATSRGVFDFGPVAVSSGDIFGFRSRRMDVDHRHTLVVYPKIVPLEKLPLRPARPTGDWGTKRTLTDNPFKLMGARSYVPGDSVRHIHWKTSARRGSLHTKVFDPSASQQLLICLNNQTLDRHYGGVLVDELETAIVAAASLAHAALEAAHPIGFVSNGSLRDAEGLARLPASRHAAQEQRLLEMLAQLTYFTGMPFEDLLRAETAHLPFGTTVIAITTLITDAILTELLNMKRKGYPVAVVVVGSNNPIPAELASFTDQIPVYTITQSWKDLETLNLA